MADIIWLLAGCVLYPVMIRLVWPNRGRIWIVAIVVVCNISRSASATNQNTRYTPPFGIDATDGGQTYVTVSWSASSQLGAAIFDPAGTLSGSRGAGTTVSYNVGARGLIYSTAINGMRYAGGAGGTIPDSLIYHSGSGGQGGGYMSADVQLFNFTEYYMGQFATYTVPLLAGGTVEQGGTITGAVSAPHYHTVKVYLASGGSRVEIDGTPLYSASGVNDDTFFAYAGAGGASALSTVTNDVDGTSASGVSYGVWLYWGTVPASTGTTQPAPTTGPTTQSSTWAEQAGDAIVGTDAAPGIIPLARAKQWSDIDPHHVFIDSNDLTAIATPANAADAAAKLASCIAYVNPAANDATPALIHDNFGSWQGFYQMIFSGYENAVSLNPKIFAFVKVINTLAFVLGVVMVNWRVFMWGIGVQSREHSDLPLVNPDILGQKAD